MDIVERLRCWSPEESTHELHENAADEIERLRAIMETVADALYDKGDYECWAALRNALWQEGEKK